MIINEKYNLLRKKDILGILDGDSIFGEITNQDGITIKVSMPYLSGPMLCDISSMFGLPVSYLNDEKLSRWQYLDNLFNFCIQNKNCSQLLAYLFSMDRFIEKLKCCSTKEIKAIYEEIIEIVIDKINSILLFGGNELAIVGGLYIIKPLNSTVEIDVPSIRTIDRDYIISISNRATEDITNKNYDSVITKSRTLIEEVCCYVLEKKNITPTTSGNLNELFKQVKNTYNLHNDPSANKSFNGLISGLNSIISAISELRNHESDAHGVGNARAEIKEYHARLILNSSTMLSDFLLSISV